jgi:hypothetical protein
MATGSTSGGGMDFWPNLEMDPGTDEPPESPPYGDILVAGRAAGLAPHASGQVATAGAPASASTAPTPGSSGERAESRQPTTEFAMPPRTQDSGQAIPDNGQDPGRSPEHAPGEIPTETPRPPETRNSGLSSEPRMAPPAGPRTAHPGDPAWGPAEQIARSLQPDLPEIWLEVLTRYTDGDEAMARRVYDVLTGCHLLGELWRDENIDEVHIQGTDVTVCGRDGMHPVAGFPSADTAQRAVEAFTAAYGKEAVVSRIDKAVIVSRRPGAGPDAGWLLAQGVITDDQLSQVTMALRHMCAVTVTGPAARIVVRALASVIPTGSRVFLGSYASLPAGCVTAATPMEADFVVGVRPGAVAEGMASVGQVGALIANPETPIRAALRFVVSGLSASPGRLSLIP